MNGATPRQRAPVPGKRSRKALISVYRKEEIGIGPIASRLVEMGFRIYSSGGTAKYLRNFVEVTDVATVTRTPAILDHRVVTLHPRVHGGLLARDTPAHDEERGKHRIPWFDVVIVDLYPLDQKIASGTATDDDVRELVDIGGPTMLSSAAKGRRIVVSDMKDCHTALEWIEAGCPDKDDMLRWLEAKADFVVSVYRMFSARHFGRGAYEGLQGGRVSEHKAENGWQGKSSLYRGINNGFPLAVTAFQKAEPEVADLSHNNLCDIDRAVQTATHIGAALKLDFSRVPFIALGVKHGNACGAAVGDAGDGDTVTVLRKMIEGDPQAIFGGLVLVNFEISAREARVLREHRAEDAKRVLDVIMAPSFTPEARDILRRKEGKCRMMVNLALLGERIALLDTGPRFRYFAGGDFTVQPNYTFVLTLKDVQWNAPEWSYGDGHDLLLAWAIASTSNSNTITIVREGQLMANAVAQQSRVAAAELAVTMGKKAGHSLQGALACSDSFFPFADGPKVLAEAGIKSLFTTTGSRKDDEVFAFLRERGVKVATIPDDKGRMFFGH